MKVKEESEKTGLKLNIKPPIKINKFILKNNKKNTIKLKKKKKTQHSKNKDHGIQSYHFMANTWGNMETVSDFIFLGSKITADCDCSHEIKMHWLLGRKAMINLDSIL